MLYDILSDAMKPVAGVMIQEALCEPISKLTKIMLDKNFFLSWGM